MGNAEKDGSTAMAPVILMRAELSGNVVTNAYLNLTNVRRNVFLVLKVLFHVVTKNAFPSTMQSFTSHVMENVKALNSHVQAESNAASMMPRWLHLGQLTNVAQDFQLDLMNVLMNVNQMIKQLQQYVM